VRRRKSGWNALPSFAVYRVTNMSALQDIRLACRLLRRTPALTGVAVFSIAVSVGATAVVFTAIKSVLIEPLPYSRAGELVQIRTEYSNTQNQSRADWVSWNDTQDVVTSNQTLASVGTYHYALFNLAGDRYSLPEALYGLSVSANVFPTLGVAPMLGRNILPEEDQPGREHEMILSYGLWTRRFNADRNVIGRTIQVNDHACTIIGVMPPGFDFPMRLATSVRTPSLHMDFWAPLAVDPAKANRGAVENGAVARLRKGISLAQAQQDLASVSARLAREYPRTNEHRTLRMALLRERTLGFAQTGLLLLMGAALIFLLIGCANVANLLLARALARHREIAVRLALGAGRTRIVRQLITESCVLGVLGGLVGYSLTVVAWTILPAIAPMTIPRLSASHADWTVFAFTLAVSLINSILFGIAPALSSARRSPAAALRDSGTRGPTGGVRNRLRSALVVTEVALAVVLVVIGGLLTGSFVRLLRTNPGFQADRVLASIIVPSGDRYKSSESRRALFRRVLDSVRTLPGVESAGTVDALPFSGENHGGFISTGEGVVLQPGAQPIAETDLVSADYLPAMGARLLQGRWFRDEDVNQPNDVAIVSDAAANLLWPGRVALGKRICVNCTPDKPQQWKQVIGVVTNMRHSGLDEQGGAEVYLASGALENAQFLVVRTYRPAGDLTKAIRSMIAAIDPNQPVFLSATMSSLIADSVSDRRFIMTLLAITGLLALLLSAAGVYGVVSYATSRRTQEMGVRMALGASPRQVQALIFGQGMWLAGIGAGIGLAVALALTRVLRTVLLGLQSSDPALVAIAVGLVILVASIACWMPTRHATRIDPMSALRQE